MKISYNDYKKIKRADTIIKWGYAFIVSYAVGITIALIFFI